MIEIFQTFHSLVVCTFKIMLLILQIAAYNSLSFINTGKRSGFETFCTCFRTCSMVLRMHRASAEPLQCLH